MPLLDWGRPIRRETIAGRIHQWRTQFNGYEWVLTVRSRGKFWILMLHGSDESGSGWSGQGKAERKPTSAEAKEWAEDKILTPAEQLVLSTQKAWAKKAKKNSGWSHIGA